MKPASSSATLLCPTVSTARVALAPAPAALEDLHPALWRAWQLGRSAQAVCASGYLELDAQLPGGGWPCGALTELLLPHPGVGELRLLAPALATLQAARRGLLWLDPPALPGAATLAALGLDLRRLVLVAAPAAPATPDAAARSGLAPAELLWALEQALRSGHLGAVLAWLPPRLPRDALRRLQLAAQAHDGPVFLLRDASLAVQPSAAPLRLRLDSAGADRLQLRLLKRRGPPAAAPLTLALPPVLPPALQARAAALAGVSAAATAAAGRPSPSRVA